MALTASGLLRVKKIRFHGGTVSVVARAALAQNIVIVSMNAGEGGALMAIETSSFEAESSAPADFVALDALDAGNRRVLMI
jgi:hypothetical protein